MNTQLILLLVPAEYAPLTIRTRAAALATATNCKVFRKLAPLTQAHMFAGIFTFLVVEITPVSISSIGYRTYIYFAGVSPSLSHF